MSSLLSIRVVALRGERRTSARFPCGQEMPLRMLGAEGIRWACLLDMSIQGAGLMLCCSVPLGTRLELQLRNHRRRFHRAIIGQVVRRTDQRYGNWFLACRFEERLTEAELRTLTA